MKGKKITPIIVLIFVVAYIVRIAFLPQNSLTFGYDQARDAIISQQILKGDVKIQGPPASTPGLYHGVFYYYVLAPAYLVGNGSPILAAYWIAFLNSLATLIIAALVFQMTKNAKASILSAILYAFSFEATQYSTWLSNPTLGILTVPLGYLGLWIWLKKPHVLYGPIIAATGLGLSIQSEIFLAYHLVPFAIWIFYKRRHLKPRSIFIFVLTLILAISTMIVSQVKFGAGGINGLLSIFSTNDAIISSKGLGDIAVLYLNQLGKTFAYNIYPSNVGYAGIFAITLIIISLTALSKRNKLTPELFLTSWILSHLSVVSLGGTSTPFLLVGIGPAVCMLVAIFLIKLWKDKNPIFILIIFAIIAGNLSAIFKQNPKGQVIFAIQKDMVLSKQLSAIDYTYKSADLEMFSTNSLTSPLWINIVWTYLYNWYGLPKYGYKPEWHGKDQIGQIASLPARSLGTKNSYLILEPLEGIPPRYLDETIGEEDTKTDLIDEKNFGEIIIQKRIFNDEYEK